MSETLFCYCCRVHHPREQMHSFQTRQGSRWRCRRSIDAARTSIGERDAFGRQQTEINIEENLLIAERKFVPRAELRLQR